MVIMLRLYTQKERHLISFHLSPKKAKYSLGGGGGASQQQQQPTSAAPPHASILRNQLVCDIDAQYTVKVNRSKHT